MGRVRRRRRRPADRLGPGARRGRAVRRASGSAPCRGASRCRCRPAGRRPTGSATSPGSPAPAGSPPTSSYGGPHSPPWAASTSASAALTGRTPTSPSACSTPAGSCGWAGDGSATRCGPPAGGPACASRGATPTTCCSNACTAAAGASGSGRRPAPGAATRPPPGWPWRPSAPHWRGRPRAAAVTGAFWAWRTGRFAWRRIAPGPRTGREVLTMVVTSAAIPPAACWHRLRGHLRWRRARPLGDAA